ncbi:MAG: hypothetical protein K6L60_14750, partial [Oceanobacter sp.]
GIIAYLGELFRGALASSMHEIFLIYIARKLGVFSPNLLIQTLRYQVFASRATIYDKKQKTIPI